MTSSSETQHSQVHPEAIETLAVDAIHAVVDGNLGEMVEETNELLEKADAPVHVVEVPPRTLEEIVQRSRARSPEDRVRRREDIIHIMTGRQSRNRRLIISRALGGTVTTQNH